MRIISENVERVETRGRKAKYPWDQWLRHGTLISITHTEDFECSPQSMRQMLYNQAMKRHGTVSTKYSKDLKGNIVIEVTFQFHADHLRQLERRARTQEEAAIPARLVDHRALASETEEDEEDYNPPELTPDEKAAALALISDPNLFDLPEPSKYAHEDPLVNRNGRPLGPPK